MKLDIGYNVNKVTHNVKIGWIFENCLLPDNPYSQVSGRKLSVMTIVMNAVTTILLVPSHSSPCPLSYFRLVLFTFHTLLDGGV